MMIEVKAKPDFATEQLKYLYNAMRKDQFTDVHFNVGNRSFFAHMIVLASCSEFFQKNKNNLDAIFSDFREPVVDAMLIYCYLGEIHIKKEHFEQFMELAKKLQINIIDLQHKTIHQGNCLEVLRLSDDPKSREKAMSLTPCNFKILHKTPDFLNLPASALAEILKSDNLNSLAEEVFHSVKLWISYDETNRRSESVELLSLVNLTSLSIEFLVMEVMTFCASYPECIGILKQTMLTILPNYQRTNQNRKSYKIALVGDYNADFASSIDIYDEKTNSWSLSKDFNFNRSSFVSVLVDDWILIIGGFYSLDKVDYIDLKDGQKHPLEPLNQGRCFFSAVTLRNDSSTDVYVIGGYDFDEYFSSVER
ncbi:kelch-like protein 28 [Arctopsyche grandis]|uniref:kelch-like protein 28 n=1 Tax=Arctopsyche grandis TaxID=121162 RepID=UPI00406DA289